MPELPEVETIVRELHRAIKGKTLSRFLVYDTERLAKSQLTLPLTIDSVTRHGKYIVCSTKEGVRCLVHLRMTGELLLKKQQSTGELRKHERAQFLFKDGASLSFIDIRRFGTIDWLAVGASLPKLGVDPLSHGFNAAFFHELAANSKKPVKSFLLDQTKIAGIGNIYADEALWTAKINPTRKAGSIKKAEARELVKAIKGVLREG